MRKHLLVTLLLLSGMPLCGIYSAQANPAPQTQSQTAGTIVGTVLDENNEPIIGASVVQKGTKNAAATDVDGHFSLKVAPGATLVVSYVGYKTVDIAATKDMVVYMQPTTEMLNELVAIGYGSQKRANLTGAVATVDVARTMDSRSTADITKALQGAVPGLTITNSNGDINGTPQMKIRGIGTLSNSGASSPLIVVDGVPTEDLSYLDPNDIADISVLKDASSAAVYGTRAAFGVLLITTKMPQTQDRVSVSYSNNIGWSQATTLPSYSSVPNQLRALMQANNRAGLENELFGMYLDKMLPYAEAWEAQNAGQPAGYREMRPFQSWDDVGDYYVNPDGSGAMYYANWDVPGIMFNNAAPSNRHNVSLEGTSGKTQYRLSFGYTGQQGLMNYFPEKMHRYNATANISTQIFSWLKGGARIQFADKEYFSPVLARRTYEYMWRWGSYFGPYGWMRDADGEPVDARNDIAYRKQAGEGKDIAVQTRMTAWLEAQICKGLSLHADFTYDFQHVDHIGSYQPVWCWNTWGGNISTPAYAVTQGATDARQSNTKDDLWTMNVYGTYDLNFAQDFNLKVMLGATAERERYSYIYAQKDYLLVNNQPYIELATGGTNGDSYSLTNTLRNRSTAGFFGRINFDYKGIYLLELNGRYDGSSRFPKSKQWGFFPSGSIGYRFSEEGYFKELKHWWSNGKVRASWGQIGNEAVGNYRFISTISQGSSNWLVGTNSPTVFNMPTLVSEALTWEKVETVDAGIDLGFFNNSLNLNFDWYQRTTKDMLGPGPDDPAVLGASAPYQNNGELRSRGWELSAGWNHSFGDADVYVNASIGDANTKITKWNNANNSIYSWTIGQSNYINGGTYGDIWGFETDRYFEEADFTGKDENGQWIYAPGIASQTGLQSGSFVYGPGDVKFKDLNGDGVINNGNPNMIEDANGNIYVPGDPGYEAVLADDTHKSVPVGTIRNHGDMKVIGNAMPHYEYSFRIGGAFKGFDIDMFFQGVGKRDLWFASSFNMPLMRGADGTYSNQDSYNKMIFDDNNQIIGYEIDQNNDFPCLFPGNIGYTLSGFNTNSGCNNFYTQSRYLMNMAYLRFKTLTVGYTLPVDLTRKAFIQKARIYFSADNLALLYNGNRKSHIDPEITWGSTSSNTAVGNSNGSATFGRTTPMMRTFSFGVQVTL